METINSDVVNHLYELSFDFIFNLYARGQDKLLRAATITRFAVEDHYLSGFGVGKWMIGIAAHDPVPDAYREDIADIT